MAELRPQKEQMIFVRADDISACASFIVGHSIECGEDIIDSTWEAVDAYVEAENLEHLLEGSTESHSASSRRIESVGKSRSEQYNVYSIAWTIVEDKKNHRKRVTYLGTTASQLYKDGVEQLKLFY